MEKNTINLIWQTSPGDCSTFEYEYITNVLFKHFDQKKYFDYQSYNTFIDNAIIIYSNDHQPLSDSFINYLHKYKQLGYSFYLLHLSNESGPLHCEHYKNAKYVFRNYFYKELKDNYNNILYLPLGFKTGFLNTNEQYNIFKKNKEFDFAFIGQIKSDRALMVSNIIKHKYFLHQTRQWNCPTSLTTQQIKHIYENTKFIPCPMGNCHVDSFRICETLESNSIPVLKMYNNEDYSQNIFPNNPFPKVKDWNELPDLLEKDYNSLFITIHKYYKNFKLDLNYKINNIFATHNT